MGNNTNNFSQEEKSLKKSYYEIMNKTLKNRYEKNRNDGFNLDYSLHIKEFDKCYTNQRMISHYNCDFIPWKTFLMRGLNLLMTENSCLWANTLYNYVKNENFPNQLKYQNMFFYQEILILTKPKAKIWRAEDSEDKNDTFNQIKTKISNNLMGSFISGDAESLNTSSSKDPNNEYQYNKNKIKEYMDIFKEHISYPDHPINNIISSFINEFVPYIINTIDYYKNNNNLNEIGCKNKSDDIIKQCKDFIVLMQNVIKLFYSRSISYCYFKDEKDEFLNLVCLIIFNSDKIYNKFFELFELMNMDKINLLNDKFELLGDLQPQEMGVKDKFCLNEVTANYIEKLKTEKNNEPQIDDENDKENELALNFNGKEKILDDDDNNDNENNVHSLNNNEDNDNDLIETNILNKDSKLMNSQDHLKITSESGKLNMFIKNFSLKKGDKELNKVPYGLAIEFIKKIIDFRVPLEKLVITASVSNLITECVNSYWKNMNKIIKPSMLSIDADELMTIFIYIVYKCHMPLLFVHADFIKYFTSQTTKSTMIGYYYTTLQGCLDYLLEVKNKEDFTKESME